MNGGLQLNVTQSGRYSRIGLEKTIIMVGHFVPIFSTLI